MLRKADDARFWDRIARKYASDPIKDMAGYERTIERTGRFLKPEDTVLEIGCGTGSTALRLAPLVASIVGTDISGEMIAIAGERARAQNCTNATFAVADALSGPGAQETYDAVLAFNLLHLVPDRPAVLAQACRLLKPGGLLLSKTPCLSEMNRLIRLAVPVMRMAGKAPFVSFFTAAELEADFPNAGLAVLERERHGSGRRDARIFIVARKEPARSVTTAPAHLP